MPKQLVDVMLETMKDPSRIRNIAVIAHVDHGKSTLTDSLITEAGLMSEKHTGSQTKGRITDTMQQERDRGITIQSTAVTLHYEIEEETLKMLDERISGENKEKKEKKESSVKENSKFSDEQEIEIKENDLESSETHSNNLLVNLIDSPGHVDFNSEVTSALRVTDGALVIIDCLEGVCVQTETVLVQALTEKIKPILFLNKLDRIFLETKPQLEDAYLTLKESIESVDVICQTFKTDNESSFNLSLSPEYGNVGFGSGLHNWGFTLKTFASMYSLKFGIKIKKLMKILWGNYYYNNKTNKFELFNLDDKEKLSIERAFVTLILNPIKKLCDTIMDNKKKEYEPIIESLRLNITKEDLKLIEKQKDYLKLVLKRWLPLGQCLVGMINEFLPSPLESQKYRYNLLYNGDLNNKEAIDIKNCNNKGIMSMYISKLVPYGNSGRFVAFGRVFSGNIKTGDSVYILNGNDSEEIKEKKISKLYLMIAKNKESLPICYAGNLCSIAGIDDYINKTCTLSNNKTFNPFKSMSFSVSPVVKYSINCKNAKDLPKLLDGLKKLSKLDQIIQIETSKNGENIIAGAGELHLEVSIERLKTEILNNKIELLPIKEPIVKICESISTETQCNLKTDKQEINLICGKSRNKLNRLYMNAEPLNNQFINDIENGKININLLNKNVKLFKQQFDNNNDYGLDKEELLNIWTFGCPPDCLPNILINKTKGESYINDVKQSIINTFMNCTNEGVLCKENVRGIKYNLKYVKLHTDRTHRNQDEISKASRKIFYGSQLSSNPILLQPMYDISIQTNLEYQNIIIKSLQIKGGQYNQTIFKRGNIIIIKGYLPVLESFGFTGFIRKETSGRAYPQMQFSHWVPIKGNPLEENTPSNKLLLQIRKRKGDNPTLPTINDFHDRV